MLLRFSRRRGFSTVQWMLLAALLVTVMMASIQLIGRESSDRLETTSGAVGNPADLKNMMK